MSNNFLDNSAPWPAPAKLNLFLHIVGRRADGYHLLQTAFQFIDLSDELRFYSRPAGVIERSAGPQNVPAEHDLVVRAAKALNERAGSQHGIAIELNKCIPMQAGLGGGSSDAATVLVALNQLWSLGLEIDELAAIGLKLGADVPVFVRGQASWAEGVGEQLTPLEFTEPWFLVIQPPVSVSTAEIFQSSELTRDTPVTTIRAFRVGEGRNDCTKVVCSKYPAVAQAIDWLGKYGEARLTGTGACIFAGFEQKQQAEDALAQLPADIGRGFVVKGLNHSPLMQRLHQEQATV
ncbi:MAG TPA: 4-(cytidine 5'-diphospho)-2-C-methyl-D-erythritol kinase [Steroidobacteraceae bacterium]|nr:4-(cytidine 5'-diphospho)-2-C-methyl-D-erythritol kinase [Steroidobacteraceae bacterium]